MASRLKLSIDWRDEADGQTFQTLAIMAVLVDDAVVWPAADAEAEPFECFADDLLSHLVEGWKPLLLRQTYPIPVQAERPSLLRVEAEKRWASRPARFIEPEEEQVTAFEGIHNLASAFGGVYGLPPLWLMSSGDGMTVETEDGVWSVPHREAITALEDAGNEIADRLDRIDEKTHWSKLLVAWQRRDGGESSSLIAWSIGVKYDLANRLVHENVLSAPQSVIAIARDDDELRIAARMAGALSFEHIRQIVELVRACPSRSTSSLDQISKELRNHLQISVPDRLYAYEQGVAAAVWLRERLQLSAFLRVEPFEILERLNVDTRLLPVEPATLDGIAVWGGQHGPSVVVNTNSARLRSARSRAEPRGAGVARATASHELCHLILDRGLALAAIDVAKGRMPLRVEQRARAFAAEFLLPSRAAGEAWRNAQHPLDYNGISKVLKRLCDRFGVTRSVAAWKLEHGIDQHASEQIAAVLDELVPQRRDLTELASLGA